MTSETEYSGDQPIKNALLLHMRNGVEYESRRGGGRLVLVGKDGTWPVASRFEPYAERHRACAYKFRNPKTLVRDYPLLRAARLS